MISLDENLNEVDDGMDNEPEGYWSTDDTTLVINQDKESKQFVIDFDKVNTLEEVILVLKAMNLHIIAQTDGKGQFEEIFHMLKEA